MPRGRMRADHGADITIGVLHDHHPPPWGADVFVPELTGTWRIMHALPAARAVRQRGMELSASGSLIGALMLIPGVPGTGAEPVNAGAIAGLWSGFLTRVKVFRDTQPSPEPVHDWHALSVEEVRRLLPRPVAEPITSPARCRHPGGGGTIRLASGAR